MNVQLRVRLPALEHLRADSAVDWAQLHKGEVLAHGRDTLATLGPRHPQAAVRACLDPNDLILLELQLPPLSGRRLQSALQGEVEAMLLDDLQEVALAHGAQAADGTVPVAWLGQQAIAEAQQLLGSCGLQLQALYPTPLLLPWQDGQATLQVSGEHLLVRSGRDRGFVQWYGGRDACAVMQALASACNRPACRPCSGSMVCRQRGRTACRPPPSRMNSRPLAPCQAGHCRCPAQAGKHRDWRSAWHWQQCCWLHSACSSRSRVGGSRVKRCNRTWPASSAHASRRSPTWWTRCCRQGEHLPCRCRRRRCRRCSVRLPARCRRFRSWPGKCAACITNPGSWTWSWMPMPKHWPTIRSGLSTGSKQLRHRACSWRAKPVDTCE